MTTAVPVTVVKTMTIVRLWIGLKQFEMRLSNVQEPQIDEETMYNKHRLGHVLVIADSDKIIVIEDIHNKLQNTNTLESLYTSFTFIVYRQT